jgi:hypothetical protein
MICGRLPLAMTAFDGPSPALPDPVVTNRKLPTRSGRACRRGVFQSGRLDTVLDVIAACAPEGAEPGQVFETIEAALRAEYAKAIE